MASVSEIMMGKQFESWGGSSIKNITFCVTEDCNLICKYCYMTGKNSFNKMTFDVARKAVDYILSNREFFNEAGVVWEFIGGEPFLEIELIDQITDYIKRQMYLLNHPWFNKYMLSFASNGLLYGRPNVQEYIYKNKEHISIGISIDGNKIKHDKQRIKKDGSGSYEDVVKNIPLWLEQFPNTYTKSTFSHEDLPYLKDSIIHLWSLGIKNVAANVIFEDAWHKGDDIIFEEQLRQLGDYIIENKLWKDYSVRFFEPFIGFPLDEEQLYMNYCGSGKMLAIDCKGDFYPCVRFYDFSLNNRKIKPIGNIYDGIYNDRLRPFYALNLISQSKEECIKCEVATGCAWCTGNNYDSAETSTIYQRATFNCMMHKANIRANKYFWDMYSKVTGEVSPREEYWNKRIASRDKTTKYLMFITSNSIIPHCCYENKCSDDISMNDETFNSGMKFAYEKGFTPVIMGNYGITNDYYKSGMITLSNQKDLKSIEKSINNSNDIIAIYADKIETDEMSLTANCILLAGIDNINTLADRVKGLSKKCRRINIITQDIYNWNDDTLDTYSKQLDEIIITLKELYNNKNIIEINILTDIMYINSMHNCGAGENTFALAPNGKFYICPAFYFNDPDDYIGDLDSGINIVNAQLYQLKNAPICNNCDSYHCKRCKYLNSTMTGEINTPSRIQCLISHVEREKSKELQQWLIENDLYKTKNLIKDIDYKDPFDILVKSKGGVKND